MLNIKVKILDKRLGKDFPLPGYETPMSAGMDLRAMEKEDFILNPGEVRLVSSGIAMHIADKNVTALIDRVAQMLFVPVLHANFEVTEEFEETSERGEEGFGSTGKN